MGAALLASLLGSVISRIVFSLGMTFVVVTGLSELLNMVFEQAKSVIGSFPYSVVQLLGLINSDLYLNLIFSAYTACIAYVTIPRLAAGVFGAGK